MSQTESLPFEQCEDCGGVYRAGCGHTCPSESPASPGPELRERLRELDDGDPEEDVLIANGGRTSTYHVPAEGPDGLVPACGTSLRVPERNGQTRSWETRPRQWVLDRTSRYPCRDCHGIEPGEAMAGGDNGDGRRE